MISRSDHAAFAVAVAGRLRAAGVPVGLTAIEDFARALAVSPPSTMRQLYWTARVTLVRRQSDLDVFDAMFTDPIPGLRPLLRSSSASSPVPAAAGEARDGGGLPWTTLPPSAADAADASPESPIAERLPSALEGLVDTTFEELNPHDIALLGGWLESAL